MKRLMTFAALLIAACSPGEEQPSANQTENAVEKPAEVPPLTGEWSVTALGELSPARYAKQERRETTYDELH